MVSEWCPDGPLGGVTTVEIAQVELVRSLGRPQVQRVWDRAILVAGDRRVVWQH